MLGLIFKLDQYWSIYKAIKVCQKIVKNKIYLVNKTLSLLNICIDTSNRKKIDNYLYHD